MLMIRPQSIGDSVLTASNVTETLPIWASTTRYIAGERVRVDPRTLDLNFATSTYNVDGALYALGSIPGYSFARTGQVGALNSSGVFAWYASGSPAINDLGYHSFGALTNLLTRSRELDQWASGGGASITANNANGIDGTAVGDTFTAGGTSSYATNPSGPALNVDARYTASIFYKQGTGRYAYIQLNTAVNTKNFACVFDLQAGVAGSILDLGSASDLSPTARIVPGPSGFYLCIVEFTAKGNLTGFYIGTSNDLLSRTGTNGQSVVVDQAQVIEGTFPVVPQIISGAAQGSIGSSSLSLSFANGTYDATYTFDDDSTQTASTTVSGGTFTLPVYGSLNRNSIKRVELAPPSTGVAHRVYESQIGSTATITMTIASPCVVTWAAHGLADGTPIVFSTTGALPTGLTAGTTYYVKSPTSSTFNVAATVGGSAINTSGSQSGVHTAFANSNIGIDPTNDDGSNWLDVGPTNRWAMFDSLVGTTTSHPTEIDVTLTLTGRVDSLSLLNLANANSVQVIVSTVADGTIYDETFALTSSEGISSWYSWFFEEIKRKTALLVTGLPTYSNPIVQVIITGTGTATLECGNLVVGLSQDLGRTLHDSAQIGITDYSRKDVDAYGNYTIVQRAFSKRGNFKMRIAKAQVDGIHSALAAMRATPAVYSASSDYDSTLIFGFFKEFNIEIDYPLESLVSIDIEGLT